MSAEQTPDIAALAVDICSHSGRHTAGDGDHDAEQWGPCSQCTHYARVVVPVLAAAVREAEQRALREAAEAGDDASEENRLYLTQLAERYRAGGPSMPAIFLRDRADRITEPVSHEAATSGEEASKA